MNSSEFLIDFGKKLKLAREIRNLSLEAFSEASKVPIGILQSFEAGSSETKTMDFLKILDVFNKLESLTDSLLPHESLFDLYESELISK